MTNIQRVLIGFCAMLLAAAAHADLIVPGTKTVTHTFVIEDSPLLGNYDLIAFPVQGFGGAERVVPGTAFAAAKAYYGTKVYALPKGTELPEKLRAEWFADKLCAKIPVQQIDSVPESSTITAIRTTLVVSALSPAGFTLAAADEKRESLATVDKNRESLATADEKPEHASERLPSIAGAVCLVLLGLLGLFAVRRKRSA